MKNHFWIVLKLWKQENALESNTVILNFQVRLTEKVAFTLVVTAVWMFCLNLLALRLNVNLQRRNLFRVWEDLKLNHHHLLQLAVSWKNFAFFVPRRAKKKNNKRYTLANCVTDEFEKNIKKFAVRREDHRLLAKIQDVCFSAEEVCYHSICHVEYENIAKGTSLTKE